MFNTNKNKKNIYKYIIFCFFTTLISFSNTPPLPPPNGLPGTPGDDVQDVALPIDEWQEILIIPTILMGMFYIYKNSISLKPKK
jgi:hypothetical protein